MADTLIACSLQVNDKETLTVQKETLRVKNEAGAEEVGRRNNGVDVAVVLDITGSMVRHRLLYEQSDSQYCCFTKYDGDEN